MILSNFVPLISAYLGAGATQQWVYPLFALTFVATVPAIIKYLVR